MRICLKMLIRSQFNINKLIILNGQIEKNIQSLQFKVIGFKMDIILLLVKYSKGHD